MIQYQIQIYNPEEDPMNTVTIILLVILVVLIGVLIALYCFGKKTQKKHEEQQARMQ